MIDNNKIELIRNQIVEDVLSLQNEFQNVQPGTNNSRFYAWEFCHKAFLKAREETLTGELIITLCKELSSYLATFGMYTRSSRLLNADYTCHKNAIRIIFEEKYDDLWDFRGGDLRRSSALYYDLFKRVEKSYFFKPSKTLVSKILLGTLCCIFAFDTQVNNNLKGFKAFYLDRDGNRGLSKLNFSNYCEFLNLFRDDLYFELHDYTYPCMRVLDLLLWEDKFRSNDGGNYL